MYLAYEFSLKREREREQSRNYELNGIETLAPSDI